ncbi:thermonuclease family protein [Rhizobium leguminosarum]|uniref:thermonuclease family protein n=1 Tax=Rhizobium leguminosarum TaxID=384 RepID=UPI001FED39CF|nr:thermonuclease family protein [Rhizobium leguminosarum]
MSTVVQFKRRQPKQTTTGRSFPKLVAIAMVVSFGVGVSAARFISDDAGVANTSTPSSHIIAFFGGRQQPAQQVYVRAATPGVTYKHCIGTVRVHCIVDGDTLWSNGVKIRVADIDTPEVSEPRCAAEKALGDRATVRLMELVNAGPFQMQAWPGRDEDKYGRKLRVLVRDGRSLGDILVSEGLARTWAGRRQPWC